MCPQDTSSSLSVLCQKQRERRPRFEGHDVPAGSASLDVDRTATVEIEAAVLARNAALVNAALRGVPLVQNEAPEGLRF